jgi:tetrahydromethanopterin S-methyltransferase subunit D
MADNVFFPAYVKATGAPAMLDATDNGDGTWTLNLTTDAGDTALVVPGVMQAGAQAFAAPLMAKLKSGNVYTLCVNNG